MLEAKALAAGLRSRRQGKNEWQVVTRIAIEELESWYFGEWQAVRTAYPRTPANTVEKASFRHCDAIRGGTWECLERELNKAGYFAGGLRKIEAARSIGTYFDPTRCTSPSYRSLSNTLLEAIT